MYCVYTHIYTHSSSSNKLYRVYTHEYICYVYTTLWHRKDMLYIKSHLDLKGWVAASSLIVNVSHNITWSTRVAAAAAAPITAGTHIPPKSTDRLCIHTHIALCRRKTRSRQIVHREILLPLLQS